MPGKSTLPTSWIYMLLIIAATGYFTLSYLLPREAFTGLFYIFTIEFLIYFIIYKQVAKQHFMLLFWSGLVLRIVLLFSLPNLSEDVYRFIWDGRLAAQGVNPYAFLPSEIIVQPYLPNGITQGLYNQLNSTSYYSIYPPVIQGMGWLAAKLFPLSLPAAVIFLKLVLFLADVGCFFLLVKILKKLKLPPFLALLYFLNPLIIIEFTGNVHFEGLMIFFMLLATWLCLQTRWITASVFLALAIAIKLIPLILLPLFIRKLGRLKGLTFSMLTLIIVSWLFWMRTDLVTIKHIGQSINLYFRNFEFNASIYYITRWIGWMLKGYNIIAVAGPVLSVVAATIILFISLNKKHFSWEHFLMIAMFVFATWFAFATTVHPWYIASVLVFCIFTPYRFPVIWSYFALWSYVAYSFQPVKELMWMVALGYAATFGYGLWEIYKRRNITGFAGDSRP